MYQIEQIAKTIHINSFDEIAVVFPAVNPADAWTNAQRRFYVSIKAYFPS